jgi:hypothetical protein
MSFCKCDLGLISKIPGLGRCCKYYLEEGDYDVIDDDRRKRTNNFTEHMEDARLLCSQHDPFFYFWAGLVHVSPSTISGKIKHAWCHEPTKTLKMIWDGYDRRLCIGLRKAWRLYNGVPEDSADDEDEDRCPIVTYFCDLGIARDHCFSYCPDEKDKIDGWEIMASIPSFWK